TSPTTYSYTLSLHDALPISRSKKQEAEREQRHADDACLHEDRNVTAVKIIEHPVVLMREPVADLINRPESIEPETDQCALLEMADRKSTRRTPVTRSPRMPS